VIFWYEFIYIDCFPGDLLTEGAMIMAEKSLGRKDLEDLFEAFENRQDEKTKVREQRQDERFIAFEKRQDETSKAFEERQDHKFIAFEERQDERLKASEDRGIHQLHVISEGLIDQIKLLAEEHSEVIQRLDRMEKENKRQHLETRALVKSFLLSNRQAPFDSEISSKRFTGLEKKN
jgi:hypothetical protein